MQIIIVHPRWSQAKAVTLTRRHVIAALGSTLFAIAAVVLLTLALTAAPPPVAPVVSGPYGIPALSLAAETNAEPTTVAQGHSPGLRPLADGEPTEGLRLAEVMPSFDPTDIVDELTRDQISLMARQVGELQARMMQLDLLGERLAAMAGIGAEERSSLTRLPGQGGLLVMPQDLTFSDLNQELEQLEQRLAARQSDLSILELGLSLAKSDRELLPSLVPVGGGSVSSPFGWRIDPITGRRAMHEGLDFSAPRGTDIYAAAGGVVVAAHFHRAFGHMIDIDHGNNIITRYAHASRLYVGVGDLVRRGQKIAAVGSTGRSTGPHLHFEIRVSDRAVDPMEFLAEKQEGVTVAGFTPRMTPSLSILAQSSGRPVLSLDALRRNADPPPAD